MNANPSLQATALLLLLSTAQASAQNAGQGPRVALSDLSQARAIADAVISRQPTIAIRVSTKFLNELVSEPIQQTAPISTTFRGANVRGTANFRGHNELCFESLRDNRPLAVVLRGQIDTCTTARKGPAEVVSLGTTQVTGRFELAFDGTLFSSTTFSVDTCTSSRLGGVRSTSRLADNLVRRIASREAERSRPAANSLASQRAKSKIEEEGNRALQQVIAELNQSSPFGETLDFVFEGHSGPTVDISTTESFLQCLATTGQEFHSIPPGETMLSDSIVEIWIHVESDTAVLDRIENIWQTAQPEIARLIEGFENADRRLEQIVTERRSGDWLVFEIAGLPPKTTQRDPS